jgi:hypothetical protein
MLFSIQKAKLNSPCHVLTIRRPCYRTPPPTVTLEEEEKSQGGNACCLLRLKAPSNEASMNDAGQKKKHGPVTDGGVSLVTFSALS